MAERNIAVAWIEKTINNPDFAAPDLNDDKLTRAFRSIPERQGRTLRVVYRHDAESRIVITAFFDRGFRK
jgi:hypothetical protein